MPQYVLLIFRQSPTIPHPRSTSSFTFSCPPCSSSTSLLCNSHQFPSPSLARQFLQLVSKVLIHERVDDRIGDIVGEVHVEGGPTERDPVVDHQPGRKEGEYEDDGDHEQHQGRLQICHECLVVEM